MNSSKRDAIRRDFSAGFSVSSIARDRGVSEAEVRAAVYDDAPQKPTRPPISEAERAALELRLAARRELNLYERYRRLDGRSYDEHRRIVVAVFGEC